MTTVFTLAVLVSAAARASPAAASGLCSLARQRVSFHHAVPPAVEPMLSGCGTCDLPGLGIKPTSRGSPQVFLS